MPHGVVPERCSGAASAARSGCHGRQTDDGIIAERNDGFQAQVAGSLDGPFVILFKEQDADQTDDGGLAGEDADDLAASFDLIVEPLQRVGGVELGAVLSGKTHAGEDIGLAPSMRAVSLARAGLLCREPAALPRPSPSLRRTLPIPGSVSGAQLKRGGAR